MDVTFDSAASFAADCSNCDSGAAGKVYRIILDSGVLLYLCPRCWRDLAAEMRLATPQGKATQIAPAAAPSPAQPAPAKKPNPFMPNDPQGWRWT